jgi:general secretion pathway protein F
LAPALPLRANFKIATLWRRIGPGSTQHPVIEFSYKAASAQANGTVSGQVSAASVADAVRILAERGLMAFEVRESHGVPAADETAKPAARSASTKVTADDTALALLQIATLCEAGVPLDEAFSNAAQAAGGTGVGLALTQVNDQLRQGLQLSHALAHSKLNLRSDVVQLIAAGEAAGKISTALRAAQAQMERDIAFRKEVMAGLTYPAVLLLAGIVSISVMFVFVIPKFASVLNNPKADIPLFAQWILKTGLWVGQNGTTVLVGATGLVVLGFVLANSAAFRQSAWDAMAKTWPFAPWIHHIEVASWASTLSLMLRNSVPLLSALELAGQGFRSSGRRRFNEAIIRDIRAGQTVATSLRRHADLDAMSLSLVSVGERSGALAQTVNTLYEMHFDRSKRQSAQILKLAEPVAILLIALVLGAIMMSIMLAVTSLSTTI